MRVNNDKILVNEDASVNITSEAIPLYMIYAFAIQVQMTGSLTGSLVLQGSCDNEAPVTWTDIQGSAQSIVAPQTHLWNATAAGYSFVRVVWTVSSGTGTLSATVNKKGV